MTRLITVLYIDITENAILVENSRTENENKPNMNEENRNFRSSESGLRKIGKVSPYLDDLVFGQVHILS